MKISIILLLILLWHNAFAQSVRYATLVCTNSTGVSLPVCPSEVVEMVGYDFTFSPLCNAYTTNGLELYFEPFPSHSAVPIPLTITGVTNISLSIFANDYSWATFKITTPAPTPPSVISNYVPADAIVIPASATGNVQIILESSSDLVNWSAANPGTYSAVGTTNRFFRVRASVLNP